MSFLDSIFSRIAHNAIEGMMQDMNEDSRPYLYMALTPFGGHDQATPDIPIEIPSEVLEAVKDEGGMLSIETQIVEPDEDNYMDGVLCTFHARSRMEAAGALMAFATMNDSRLEMAVMQNVIAEVADLDAPAMPDGKPSEVADQIYEFTKTETGDLIIAFPTQSDDGSIDYSGTFVTLRAPRRTDSEVARLVLQASNTIYAGGLLPALMCSLHRDIDAYGSMNGHHPTEGP